MISCRCVASFYFFFWFCFLTSFVQNDDHPYWKAPKLSMVFQWVFEAFEAAVRLTGTMHTRCDKAMWHRMCSKYTESVYTFFFFLQALMLA